MPWQHCENDVADNEECPDCGITKQAWTLEWNLTRTFTIKRGEGAKNAVKIALQNPEGKPVPEEPFAVTLPDGSVFQGKLDKYGYGKVPCEAGGEAQIFFPCRVVKDFPSDLQVSPDAGEDEARFLVEAGGKKTVFKLQPTRPTFLVVLPIDPDEASSRDDRFILTSEDGEYEQVKTVKDDLVPGDHVTTVEFTDLVPKKTYTLTVDLGGGDGFVRFKGESYTRLTKMDPKRVGVREHKHDLEPFELEDREDSGEYSAEPQDLMSELLEQERPLQDLFDGISTSNRSRTFEGTGA